uniref:Uncharacterized protein n=1 Tax=Zea mays TaxID=4577 RepID=A0A804NRY9_MAIZE
MTNGSNTSNANGVPIPRVGGSTGIYEDHPGLNPTDEMVVEYQAGIREQMSELMRMDGEHPEVVAAAKRVHGESDNITFLQGQLEDLRAHGRKVKLSSFAAESPLDQFGIHPILDLNIAEWVMNLIRMRGGSTAGNPDGTSSPSSSFFQGLSREIPGAPVEPRQEVQQPEMALAVPNPSIQPTDRGEPSSAPLGPDQPEDSSAPSRPLTEQDIRTMEQLFDIEEELKPIIIGFYNELGSKKVGELCPLGG